MPGFDARAWNLFGALALALPACGGDTASPHRAPGDSASDDDNPCAGQAAQDGFRCSDPDDYDDGYDTEDYGCETHADCGAGNICIHKACATGDLVRECTDVLSFSAEIPLPGEAGPAMVLTAIAVDADLEAELVVQADDGVKLVDPSAGTEQTLAVEQHQHQHVALAGRFDASTPDDLILHDLATGAISILRNDGVGGLGQLESVGSTPFGVELVGADLDGDGNLDLYAGGQWWPGDGAGGFGVPAALAGLETDGPVARFNADLDIADELLGIDAETGALSTLDAGMGLEPLMMDAYPPALDLAVADLDGDTLEDALRLGRDGDTSVLSVVFGDQTMIEARHLGLVGRHAYLAVADLDADGWPELIGWSQYADPILVYRGLGGSRPCFSQTGLSGRRVAVGDFDGDGRDELAVSGGDTTGISGLE